MAAFSWLPLELWRASALAQGACSHTTNACHHGVGERPQQRGTAYCSARIQHPLSSSRLHPPPPHPQPLPTPTRHAETKAAIALYENVANGGDAHALARLRGSIEGRIDALESFYLAHVDDERSVLFEKQRLKLRKLLHEYDAYAASINAAGAAAAATPGGNGGGAASGGAAPTSPTSRTTSGGGVTTRVIREDTRLALAELTAWFEQAGADEMP